MKMEQAECSETSAYTIQTVGNYPEENIQHTESGESLKSRNVIQVCTKGNHLYHTHVSQHTVVGRPHDIKQCIGLSRNSSDMIECS